MNYNNLVNVLSTVMIIYIYISIRQADLSVVMDNGVEWCSILVSFKENCNVNKKYRFNYFLNQKKHCCQCFSLSFFALRHICYSPNNFLTTRKTIFSAHVVSRLVAVQ